MNIDIYIFILYIYNINIYIYILIIYIYIYIYIYIKIRTIINILGPSKRQISRLILTYGCFQGNLFEIVKITN